MDAQEKPAVVRKQMTVKATPVVVWETLSTKQGLEKFFARKVDIDLREGGKATFALTESFAYEGTITKVVPLRALNWEEDFGGHIQTVEWTLESEEGGKSTKITMVASGFGLTNEGVVWGWETVMRAFQWVLEEQYHHGQTCYLGLRGGLTGMGFKVFEVLPESPAAHAGVQPGDRIQGIGGHTLCGISWMADVIHQYKPDEPLEISIVRKGGWIPETIQLTPSAWYVEMGERDIV